MYLPIKNIHEFGLPFSLSYFTFELNNFFFERTFELNNCIHNFIRFIILFKLLNKKVKSHLNRNYPIVTRTILYTMKIVYLNLT